MSVLMYTRRTAHPRERHRTPFPKAKSPTVGTSPSPTQTAFHTHSGFGLAFSGVGYTQLGAGGVETYLLGAPTTISPGSFA
ncbi:hypothetical protein FKM82_020385 [Ascaphus truei]